MSLWKKLKRRLSGAEACSQANRTETALLISLELTSGDRSAGAEDKGASSNGSAHSATQHVPSELEDVTVPRKQQRPQRDELFGQLLVHIVHDMRNCLNVILGHGEMLRLSVGDDATLCWHASEIYQAVERASELAARLEALGGTESQQLERLDLNLTVQQSLNTLRGALRRDLSLNADLEPGPIFVVADAAALKQALLHLVMIARDAMSGTGSVDVRTRRVRIPVSELEKDDEALYQSYAVLTVADGGRRKEEKTRLRVVDPFDSIRLHGGVAGLGLASVHATARSFGGWLDIQSADGEGTSASLYIPAFP